jgi:hypothetical protein
MVDSEPPTKLSLSDVTTKATASEDAPSVEDPQISPVENSSQADGAEYLTGYKLAVVLASIILCCYLMLLDNLIVSTVSHLHASCHR